MSFGGKKTQIESIKDAAQRQPFDSCTLSLRPFTQPVCTRDGSVFERDNIEAYIKEYHKHPVTGEPLAATDLVTLNYHKSQDGKYVDPVSLKPFSEFSKIAANAKSGNVYLWESLEEFNIKEKNWTDLVSGEPFKRQDIIVLQDPKAKKKAVVAQGKESTSGATKSVKPATPTAPKSTEKRPYNAASYSKGQTAASFTSTTMTPVTKNESDTIDDEEFMFARIKDKGYARIVTDFGDINLELYCDKAPITCYNFIKLAQSGYYKGVKFHRSIKNFMLQGGDPTGTGRGGKSFWGKDFKDEIKQGKSHSERGVLSMANRGPNTNSSQFFILYRAATHLDGKHTIFGRVVGGLPVLAKIEAVPTDSMDRPEKDVVIRDVKVFVDPFGEFQKRLERKIEHEESEKALKEGKRKRTEEEELEHERNTTTWLGTKVPLRSSEPKAGPADGSTATASRRGVGRYLKKVHLDNPKHATDAEQESKAQSGYKFGDFGDW
ncbi:cyclophilin peptidyl-prolyl cis-trans isomerase Cyp8 [Linderina pennispora]|nr:cyclophilin peptidyl-prolyl cis-trans isomerase Cyp8 [Linderina pennispora]